MNANSIKAPTIRRSGAIQTSSDEKIFTVINYIFFIMLGLSTIFPFINLIAKSLSSEAAVVQGTVTLYPIDFQMGTYKYLASNSMFLQAFLVSITVTLVGSQLALFMTTLAAYPLFKPRLRGRKFFIILYLFTMLFSGGLIPSYLLYFESLPNSLEESAKIDGAINMTTLARIILPLSMPILAAIGLFYAVTFWKDYFTSLIYFNSAELKQLQLYLKELFVSSTDAFMRTNVDTSLNVSPQSIQAASIILATLPIILVYPWIQKYFVKGVLVGSIKG